MPAQHRSVATAGFILDAAARILEEQGLDSYTTNAIAERVRSLTLTEGNLTLDDAFWSQKSSGRALKMYRLRSVAFAQTLPPGLPRVISNAVRYRFQSLPLSGDHIIGFGQARCVRAIRV